MYGFVIRIRLFIWSASGEHDIHQNAGGVYIGPGVGLLVPQLFRRCVSLCPVQLRILSAVFFVNPADVKIKNF